MSNNPLQVVSSLGQSIWYDNIQRSMITSGQLARLISADGVSGVTSNPTIFDKAISKSADYDAEINEARGKGVAAEALYWDLVIGDIRRAADLFFPVYQQTRGRDGYISLEVSPLLARDTAGTVAQARELFARVAKKNIMIKVPATREGVAAVRILIAGGMNINVTLIFSVRRYEEVMEAYLSGLEEFFKNNPGRPAPASVASFFVSRMDSMVDPLLEEKAGGLSGAEAERILALRGKAAVANSKLAYQRFRAVFGSARFEALKGQGGALQRPLWASTSTKNPAYPDVLYVDELIGPDTVNTVPPATLDAYRDHGKPAVRVTSGVDRARQELAAIEDLGISISEVTSRLEAQGVDAFAASYRELLKHLEEKLIAQAGCGCSCRKGCA
ncbi:MAG: transaldolase [Candidatus Omnitrophica bacterium]|nr:transaldolase [Candidatus Omnitrophota bacterium]